MNVKIIRRENVRAIAKAVGGITALANRVGKTQGQISYVIGKNPTKNIGDKLAADIESAFDKSPGWLDTPQESFSFTESDNGSQKLNYIPLLTNKNILQWVEEQPSHLKLNSDIPKVAVAMPVSGASFATYVLNDSMESPSGVSFPEGSIIVVDPESVMRHGSFIVVNIEDSPSVMLRQILFEGNERILKPINPRYPQITLREPYLILGVVRLMFQEV